MDFIAWKNMLLSSEAADRSEAAESLPDTGASPEVICLLVNALNDSDPLVRTSVAEAMGLIDSDDVRAALRQALRTETNELARGYVASSLGAMGHLPDLKLLTDEALNPGTTPWQKLHCAQGIAVLALDYAVRTITGTAKDPDLDLGSPAAAHLDVILNLIDSNRSFILTAAKERKGHERSELERENIRSLLSKE